MEPTEFIFHKGQFVKWNDANTHFLTHTLHYGDGAFEGIRAYETKRGPAIFRLKEHMARLLESIKPLRMTLDYSVDDLCNLTVELVKKNKVKHCYIRPLAYYDMGIMGLNPKNCPSTISIACWPWGAYLPHEAVDVKISSFIRVHPKSTFSAAKLCAHYTNSMLAVFELRDTKYHEALLCDYQGNIAEGPGENFFIVKDKKLITPAPGNILTGITRATIMKFAADMGIETIEKQMSIDEALNADEAFYTGTAAEVTPIRSIDDKVLGSGHVGEITLQLKDLYHRVVRGEESRYESYLTYC